MSELLIPEGLFGKLTPDAMEIFNAVYQTLSEIVDAAFARHGFKPPRSATSVIHNINSANTENNAHTERLKAIEYMVAKSKQVSMLAQNRAPIPTLICQELDNAIAAVERAFKP